MNAEAESQRLLRPATAILAALEAAASADPEMTYADLADVARDAVERPAEHAR